MNFWLFREIVFNSDGVEIGTAFIGFFHILKILFPGAKGNFTLLCMKVALSILTQGKEHQRNVILYSPPGSTFKKSSVSYKYEGPV